MKKYIAVIILTLLVVFWIGFIWGNSMKDGEASGEQSSKVCETVNEVAQSVGIEKPITERTVRKTAHFSEYMVLGALVCADALALCGTFTFKKEAARIAVISCSVPISALVACVDEFCIQASTEGRGPALTDVLIDSSGALCALLITFLIVFVFQLIKRKKKS